VKLIDGDALVDFVGAGEDTEDLLNSIVIEVVKNAVQKMSAVEAIPTTWIEAEIKKLRDMDFGFATLTAGQIDAMLNKWRKEAK